MDLLLDLALRVNEGGWFMGTELGLQMCFDLDVQSAPEGGGLGKNGGGCSLGVAFGGPGVVSDAGAMAGFAVLGRWFHHRKVGGISRKMLELAYII
eukprot:scaffold114797_cov51-Attheya_sp.AAC.1